MSWFAVAVASAGLPSNASWHAPGYGLGFWTDDVTAGPGTVVIDGDHRTPLAVDVAGGGSLQEVVPAAPECLDVAHANYGRFGWRTGCGVGLDTVDLYSGELLVPDGRYIEPIGDVDGDGFDDLMGAYQASGFSYFLSRPDGFEPIDWPQSTVKALRRFELPVGDVTGDGRADLIISYLTEERFLGYFYEFHGGTIALHPGGPDGYLAEPLWSLEVDEPVYDIVALQLDSDPELELAGMRGEGFDTLEMAPATSAFFTIDEVATTPQVSSFDFYPSSADFCLGCRPRVLPIGDVDGDGVDDLLLAMALWDERPTADDPYDTRFRIISSQNDFDPYQPIARLVLDDAWWDFDGGRPSGFALDSSDVDGDGRLDVVVAWETSLIDPTGLAVEVWYSPLLQEPTPTGDTGSSHTGQLTGDTVAATADTAGGSTPALTGDTAEPEDTGTSPGGARPNRKDDEDGCGCHSTGGASLLAWLVGGLALRRRQQG